MNPPLRLGAAYIDYPQYVSLGVVSNAAALRAAGCEVTVTDAFSMKDSVAHRDAQGVSLGSPLDRLIAHSAACGPGVVVVAVSPFMSPHIGTKHSRAVFEAVREAHPDACLIAADCYFSGMHYIQYDGVEFLGRFPEIDAVVKYETEARLGEAVAGCGRGAHAVIECDARDVVLDDLPLPAWDLISVENYFSFQQRIQNGTGSPKDETFLRTLPAATTRGCPFQCTFCTSNPGQRNRTFRTNSLAYVERLLNSYSGDFGAQKVVFLESAPNLDPDRFLGVLQIVESLKLKCEFPNGLRADYLTREHLKLLKAVSGAVKVSAECGSNRMLAKIGKGLSLETVESAAGLSRDLNLPLEIHYVIGFPDEVPESANETLAHALRMKERFGAVPLVQYATPIPGSDMHAYAERMALLSGFDPRSIYSHFMDVPAFDRPEFPAEKLCGMMFCFNKRIATPGTDKVIINLTYDCSNDCVFCAVGDRKRTHGDLRRILKYLQNYREAGVESVDFDGGEPTQFPGLSALTAAACALGYKNINVTTNARRLAERGAASRFLLSGLTSVLVSLHGHTAALHERHTRRQGSFDETVRGIRHIVELKPNRVAFAINTTITEWNAPFLGDMLEYFMSLEAGSVNLQFVTPHGNADSFRGYNVAQLAATVSGAYHEWKARIPLHLINLPPCVSRKLTGELEPETEKYSRDMVFADNPPMNLGKYLDQRRAKKPECASCDAAIACAGFYVFEGDGQA